MRWRGRGSGDEATGGRPHFVRAAPCIRRPHRFRVVNLRFSVRAGGVARDPTARAGGVYFEIPRGAHRIPFKFPLQLIHRLGTPHEQGGFARGLNPPCSCRFAVGKIRFTNPNLRRPTPHEQGGFAREGLGLGCQACRCRGQSWPAAV